MAKNIHFNLLDESIKNTDSNSGNSAHSGESKDAILLKDQLNYAIEINQNKEDSNEENSNKNLMLKDKLIDINISSGVTGSERYNDSVISNPFANENLNALGNKVSSKENIDGVTNGEERKTLNEPILETIKRDLLRIGMKLYYVLYPFSNQNKLKEILHWDLWGPLLFTIFLAVTLAFNTHKKDDTFILVFFLVWGGSVLIYVNSNLLGSQLNIFNMICLFGYCLVPLNIISLILALTSFYEIFRVILILFACSWSSYSAIGFLKNSTTEEKQILLLYPVVLLYLFISGVILMTR